MLIEGIALMLHKNNLFNYDINTIKDNMQDLYLLFVSELLKVM